MRALTTLGVFLFVCAADAQVGVESLNTITPGAGISDVAVRADGGTVIVGSLGASGTVDFDGDGTPDVSGQTSGANYIARYDASGTLQWVRPIGATSGEPGDLLGIERVVLGEDGAIYVGGVFTTTLDLDGDGTADLLSPDDGPDVFLASYTAAGAFQWARQLHAAAGANRLGVDGLAFQGGRLIAAGTFTTALDPDDDGTPEAETEEPLRPNGFVVTYSPEGAFLDARRLAGPEVWIGAMVALDGGGLAFGGFYEGHLDAADDGTPDEENGGDRVQDAFVAVLSASGELEWTHSIRAENGGDETVTAMTAEPDGRLYVGVLRFTGGGLDLDDDGTPDADGSAAIIGAYDADGTLRWGRPVEGLLPLISRLAIASATLYAGGLLALPFEATDGQAFIAPFSLDGTSLGTGVYRVGVEASAGTTSRGLLAADPGGELAVAGRFRNAVDFDGDGTPETPDGVLGSFLFRPTFLPVSSAPLPRHGVGVSILANPSGQPAVQLHAPTPEAVRVSVVSALGREVAVLHEGPLAGTATWRLPALAPGIYVVRVATAAAVSAHRLTVVR